MRPSCILALVCSVFPLTAEEAPKTTSSQAKSISDLIAWLLEDEDRLENIPFPDVIAATSGKKVLPLDMKEEIGRQIHDWVSRAGAAVLQKMNARNSPVKGLRRINEASRFFENALMEELNGGDFSCGFPKTAAGDTQRSGYPDLELIHKPTGRVTYVDPKLFEESSRTSTLRTFYFEPRRRTNKVTRDAHHLILGFSHDGKDGDWTFLRCDVVDVSHLKVRLKAEFDASNKEVYRTGSRTEASGRPSDQQSKP